MGGGASALAGGRAAGAEGGAGAVVVRVGGAAGTVRGGGAGPGEGAVTVGGLAWGRVSFGYDKSKEKEKKAQRAKRDV
jgi:hypothetical protein